MAGDPTCKDSPLSITASVIGILTFVVAGIISFYARVQALSAVMRIDSEIIQTLETALVAFLDARTLGEYIIEPTNDSDILAHSVVEEMFFLSFCDIIALLLLLEQTRLWRLSEWASRREGFARRSAKIGALGSRMICFQFVLLSK